MKHLIPAILAILALLWWTRIRTCADLAADCWEPWRDIRTDELEDVWVSLYEARA